jgi:ATP-dependent Clp protease protease subunit
MARNISEHADDFHRHGLYLPTRTIFIEGDEDNDNNEITMKSSTRDVKNILIVDSLGTGTITIRLDCVGGDVLAGMKIYDAIAACRNHVVIIADSAMSMGSIILQAADERIMNKNGRVMIHAGEVSYANHPSAIDNWRKYDKKMDTVHEDIYLEKIKKKKPRFTREQLQKLLEHDTILTAKEAVDMGLADKVLE